MTLRYRGSIIKEYKEPGIHRVRETKKMSTNKITAEQKAKEDAERRNRIRRNLARRGCDSRGRANSDSRGGYPDARTADLDR